MVFRSDLAEKVLAGEKTVTRRLCSENPRSPWWRDRCALRPGRTFAVQPGRGKPAIAHAQAIAVDREPLGRLSDDEARREGFATAAATRSSGRLSRSMAPAILAALVWRVELELVGEVGG